MSQLERRLTEEIASAIGYGEKMKASYDREVSERKRMTEMYLEANQACIDAEVEVERLREREEDCWKTAFTSGWEQAKNCTDWIEYEQWKAKAEGGQG